jgi:hypothetical protein
MAWARPSETARGCLWHATKTQIDIADEQLSAPARNCRGIHRRNTAQELGFAKRPEFLRPFGAADRTTRSNSNARMLWPSPMSAGSSAEFDEIIRPTGRIRAKQVNDLPIEHLKARTNSTLARGVRG